MPRHLKLLILFFVKGKGRLPAAQKRWPDCRGEFPNGQKQSADFRPKSTTCYLLYMRAVIQRVSNAKVTVDNEITGSIGLGLLVLLGVSTSDSETDADYLAEKITGLRIFEDSEGKMNLSVTDVKGSILAVSQFTLYGDARKGRRPSFDSAARPEQAKKLYDYFVEKIRATGLKCETGRFQAEMKVALVNDGPVTILLDSQKLF